MLSILIPTYNYNIVSLVTELHKQCIECNIEFEILALDDASTEYIEDNKLISRLSHTSYVISNNNIGRTSARQQLANLAKYEWLLFLDADVIPKSKKFISSYVSYLESNYKSIYGGFAYKRKQSLHNNLRWVYGKRNEEVSARARNKKPYKIVISGNFMIKKNLFLKINSGITKKSYGYDNYFGAKLKALNSKILHIDNEVYHLGLESNTKFLLKTEQAIKTLINLFNKKSIDTSQNDLLELFKKLKKWKINYIISVFFWMFRKIMRENLKSKHSSILVFQIYKLGYMCHFDLKNNIN